ncbi:17003_t:CDS:2, partial [Gigaspora rosea]
ENVFNSGSIPLAEALRQNYLKPVYEKHISIVKSKFFGKLVAIIVDETTQMIVNNTTVGQVILQTLIEWFIPFNALQLLVSDSASYKYFKT